ncbi:hypothetical protein P6709_02185 [Jeotgalibacillus sp. ET6]|uniref:hypothetical protein n=1 Tax=Jeotgalibacillus sp. ET6 TaxID=3037260 RepID=UPI0024187326|nr:hypothetical protein [Jeotgalibacillus sp. ET6]MDG5470538.1 hypothetical protein [Jeotgalibacillus sp. ET6]
MYWETLPAWFWTIYYLIFSLTFIFAAICLYKKRMIIHSLIAVLFIITIPIVGFINSSTSDRPLDMNELEFWFEQLQQGEIWAIYSLLGYIFLVFWWIFLLTRRFDKPGVK